ncbi:MAG: hypothetical protein ACRD1G_11885, partial [Acidimicrobiales bacterium]
RAAVISGTAAVLGGILAAVMIRNPRREEPAPEPIEAAHSYCALESPPLRCGELVHQGARSAG